MTAIHSISNKISAVWTMKRLEESVISKIKLLDYVFRDLTQLLERRLNEALNRRLLAFQYMGLSLAALIGLFPYLINALSGTLPPTLGTFPWTYPIVSVVIIIVVSLLSNSAAKSTWRRNLEQITMD